MIRDMYEQRAIESRIVCLTCGPQEHQFVNDINRLYTFMLTSSIHVLVRMFTPWYDHALVTGYWSMTARQGFEHSNDLDELFPHGPMAMAYINFELAPRLQPPSATRMPRSSQLLGSRSGGSTAETHAQL